MQVALTEDEKAVILEALLEFDDYLDQIDDDRRLGLSATVQAKLNGTSVEEALAAVMSRGEA
jgi:hypothetical protein